MPKASPKKGKGITWPEALIRAEEELIKTVRKTLIIDLKDVDGTNKRVRIHQSALLNVLLYAMLTEFQLHGKHKEVKDIQHLPRYPEIMRECCEEAIRRIVGHLSLADGENDYGLQISRTPKKKPEAEKPPGG